MLYLFTGMHWVKFFAVTYIAGLILWPTLTMATGQCETGWVDTHVHYGDSDFMSAAMQRFSQHHVRCALLLNMELNPNRPKRSYHRVRDFLVSHPQQYYPFFSTVGETAAGNRVAKLKAAVGDHTDTFLGMGESAFYSEEFSSTELTSNLWHKIFHYAGSHNLILMIHLRPGQAEELDEMLTEYPNTTVLLHGAEIYDSLDMLLTEHSNLYYTLDTSILLWENYGNLLYPDEGGSATMFIATYDTNAEALLSDAQARWYSLIEHHPNKIMWGTDISEPWHVNKRVYRRLLEFSEAFAEPLNNSLEKKYRRTNAVRLLGRNGVVL